MQIPRPHRIAMARSFLGVDKVTMARECEIAVGTISRIEQGLGSNPRTIAKIERYFKSKKLVFLEPGECTPGGRGIRYKS